MRIWSIHPQYLDAKGLVALWRETLLAKNVLAGNTKGYKNHPQLNRFKATDNPLDSIHQYLAVVYEESLQRGYRFNKDKIDWNFQPVQMSVSEGQMHYETQHLLHKLAIRDEEKHQQLAAVENVLPHPLFIVERGEIAEWEIR